ncbi:MAG TPA: hypothetical protein VFF50_08585 [Candidatus Deferrimicrobiaceae bacterium]|nr:hypothetical protein [Candidatus Deferrimicrobiaceae bacterium]
MKINKAYIAAGLVVAVSLFFGLVAFADQSDQTTIFTFSEPIQIPGVVLPAGTYVFKLTNTESSQNVVQVFNADRNMLYATLGTVPTDRSGPLDHSVVTVAEQGGGHPDSLLKWFYPGLETGHEFLYPKQREKELAQDKQQTIEVSPTVSNSGATAAGN